MESLERVKSLPIETQRGGGVYSSPFFVLIFFARVSVLFPKYFDTFTNAKGKLPTSQLTS